METLPVSSIFLLQMHFKKDEGGRWGEIGHRDCPDLVSKQRQTAVRDLEASLLVQAEQERALIEC